MSNGHCVHRLRTQRRCSDMRLARYARSKGQSSNQVPLAKSWFAQWFDRTVRSTLESNIRTRGVCHKPYGSTGDTTKRIFPRKINNEAIICDHRTLLIAAFSRVLGKRNRTAVSQIAYNQLLDLRELRLSLPVSFENLKVRTENSKATAYHTTTLLGQGKESQTSRTWGLFIEETKPFQGPRWFLGPP